jgi:hypothetical protein
MGLKERIAELEIQVRVKEPPFDKIYTALMQMEECTCPLAPDETEEEWMAGIIERYGTREDFIANGRLREEQRNELQI